MSEILTAEQVFSLINTHLIFPASKARFVVHLIELTGNALAPEPFAYKVAYTCSVLGERHNVTFYPKTVGVQGKSKLKGPRIK